MKEVIYKGVSLECSAGSAGDLVYLVGKIGHGNILEELLEERAPVDMPQMDSNLTPLQVAAHKGHLKCVKVLVEKGARINHLSAQEMTALYLSSVKQHYEIVEYLASIYGVIEFMETTFWNNAFLYGVLHNDVQLVKILLYNEASPTLLKIQGEYPLHFAVINNYHTMVQLLCIYSQNIDIESPNDYLTPFASAVLRHNFEVADILLQMGANASHEGDDGRALSKIAEEQRNTLALKYLKERRLWDSEGKSLRRNMTKLNLDQEGMGKMNTLRRSLREISPMSILQPLNITKKLSDGKRIFLDNRPIDNHFPRYTRNLVVINTEETTQELYTSSDSDFTEHSKKKKKKIKWSFGKGGYEHSKKFIKLAIESQHVNYTGKRPIVMAEHISVIDKSEEKKSSVSPDLPPIQRKIDFNLFGLKKKKVEESPKKEYYNMSINKDNKSPSRSIEEEGRGRCKVKAYMSKNGGVILPRGDKLDMNRVKKKKGYKRKEKRESLEYEDNIGIHNILDNNNRHSFKDKHPICLWKYPENIHNSNTNNSPSEEKITGDYWKVKLERLKAKLNKEWDTHIHSQSTSLNTDLTKLGRKHKVGKDKGNKFKSNLLNSHKIYDSPRSRNYNFASLTSLRSVFEDLEYGSMEQVPGGTITNKKHKRGTELPRIRSGKGFTIRNILKEKTNI